MDFTTGQNKQWPILSQNIRGSRKNGRAEALPFICAKRISLR
jgi:hypothetical protein